MIASMQAKTGGSQQPARNAHESGQKKPRPRDGNNSSQKTNKPPAGQGTGNKGESWNLSTTRKRSENQREENTNPNGPRSNNKLYIRKNRQETKDKNGRKKKSLHAKSVRRPNSILQWRMGRHRNRKHETINRNSRRNY